MTHNLIALCNVYSLDIVDLVPEVTDNGMEFTSYKLAGLGFSLAWFRLTVEIGSLGGEFSVLYRVLSAVGPTMCKTRIRSLSPHLYHRL